MKNAIAEATCASQHGSEGEMAPLHLPPVPLHPSGEDAVADNETMREVLSDDIVYAKPEKPGDCA